MCVGSSEVLPVIYVTKELDLHIQVVFPVRRRRRPRAGPEPPTACFVKECKFFHPHVTVLNYTYLRPLGEYEIEPPRGNQQNNFKQIRRLYSNYPLSYKRCY